MGSVLAPLGSQWSPHIVGVAKGLGLSIEQNIVGDISTWLDALVNWNAHLDLTAARSHAEACELMIADALVLSTWMRAGAEVVDVGTGAGAPGLGLALLRPDLRVTLVEPLQKRVAFLRTVVGTLAANHVRVVRARGEDLAREESRYDAAMARAVLPPAQWLELGTRLVKSHGDIYVLLAREAPPAHPDAELMADKTYVLAHNGAPRRTLQFRRKDME